MRGGGEVEEGVRSGGRCQQWRKVGHPKIHPRRHPPQLLVFVFPNRCPNTLQILPPSRKYWKGVRTTVRKQKNKELGKANVWVTFLGDKNFYFLR